MFVDKVNVKFKAGNGGDGLVNFHREKFVDHGGPDGGNGGNGGNIIFKADGGMNTLVDFYYKKHYYAEDGARGEKKNCSGANGKDIVVKVPVGTIVYLKDELVFDFCIDSEEKVILRGGRGGRGNAMFKTATRQAPSFSESGQTTKAFDLTLELKTIADVGLVGFPNVGKSSFLSVVSNAKPKIANYHFTTLTPNLGVVKAYDTSFVIADIPGLIEGASDGVGLGHDFLRHVERNRMIIHLIDISEQDGRNMVEDYFKINEELKKYDKVLASVPQLVALNKVDLVQNQDEIAAEFKKKTKLKDIYLISTATREGIDKLISKCAEMLKTLPKPQQIISEVTQIDKKENSYEITRDSYGSFVISGAYVENVKRGVVLSDSESFAYFQKRLKMDGVIDALKAKGMKQGDLVKFDTESFEWEE